MVCYCLASSRLSHSGDMQQTDILFEYFLYTLCFIKYQAEESTRYVRETGPIRERNLHNDTRRTFTHPIHICNMPVSFPKLRLKTDHLLRITIRSVLNGYDRGLY